MKVPNLFGSAIKKKQVAVQQLFRVLHIVFKETSPLQLLYDYSISNFTGISVTKDECDNYNYITHDMTLTDGIRNWAAVTQATEKH